MTKQLGSEQASGVSSLGEELTCCTLPAGPSRQSRKSRVRTGSSRVVSPQVVNCDEQGARAHRLSTRLSPASAHQNR